MDFARMEAMGSAGKSEERRRRIFNSLTSKAVLFLLSLCQIVPDAMQLARVPMTTTRPVFMVALGLAVLAIGVVFAPTSIRPTLEALTFLRDSGVGAPEIRERVETAVWRLERLLTAAMLIGALVPTVCIGLLFVPGAQALAPYLFMNRILEPLFIVAIENVVVRKEVGQGGRTKVSSKSSLANELQHTPACK